MAKAGIFSEDFTILTFCVLNMVATIQSVTVTTFSDFPSTMTTSTLPTTTSVPGLPTRLIPISDKVGVLMTPAQPIEASGDRLTTCTMRMSSPLTGTVTLTLFSENSQIAYPLTGNVTFTPHDSLTPKLVRIIGNDVGETFIKVGSYALFFL